MTSAAVERISFDIAICDFKKASRRVPHVALSDGRSVSQPKTTRSNGIATVTHVEVENPDADDGIGEALLRDAELDTNPALAMLLEQLDEQIERRRS